MERGNPSTYNFDLTWVGKLIGKQGGEIPTAVGNFMPAPEDIDILLFFLLRG